MSVRASELNTVRRAVGVLGAMLVGVAGCAAPVIEGTPVVGTAGGAPSVVVTTTSVAAPGSPVPVAEGKCPYLDSAFVADANGQHVGKVKVSGDKPHPACFFYRSDGKIQLTAQVYVGDAGAAKALVDAAAPVSTSDPASLPAGWAGGAQATGNGAVFAVAKEGSAIVITTNQKQTIKAKQVAERAIAALAL
jgi:UPF0176 protein